MLVLEALLACLFCIQDSTALVCVRAGVAACLSVLVLAYIMVYFPPGVCQVSFLQGYGCHIYIYSIPRLKKKRQNKKGWN